MASVEQCERAVTQLAEKLAGADGATPLSGGLDRTISCTIRDLGVIFGGRLRGGRLEGIRQVDSADAQIRMSTSGDDLLALVAGELGIGAAWASGRLTVQASVLDLLKLRSML
jgi:hypothetical protein